MIGRGLQFADDLAVRGILLRDERAARLVDVAQTHSDVLPFRVRHPENTMVRRRRLDICLTVSRVAVAVAESS
ncbi:MAG: hypothetical protein LBQ09_09540 [Acidobacteriaceae bacterium]|nr:hypothetical protein [Acidobacteriaceae bacterium]